MRVWESATVTEYRSRDWPVDVQDADAARADDVGGGAALRVLVEHDVTIDEGGPDYWQRFCTTSLEHTGGALKMKRSPHMPARQNSTPPRVCEYRVRLTPSDEMCTQLARQVGAHEHALQAQHPRFRRHPLWGRSRRPPRGAAAA